MYAIYRTLFENKLKKYNNLNQPINLLKSILWIEQFVQFNDFCRKMVPCQARCKNRTLLKCWSINFIYEHSRFLMVRLPCPKAFAMTRTLSLGIKTWICWLHQFLNFLLQQSSNWMEHHRSSTWFGGWTVWLMNWVFAQTGLQRFWQHVFPLWFGSSNWPSCQMSLLDENQSVFFLNHCLERVPFHLQKWSF